MPFQEVVIMKLKYSFFAKILVSVLLLPLAAVFSQEVTEVSSGYIANRKKMILNLENQVQKSISSIEKYNDALKSYGRIDTVNQTEIAMTNMIETGPVGRDQFIYTEKALILWNGAKISNVTFNTVRGRAGGDYTQKKRYSLMDEAPHKEGGTSAGGVNLILHIREKQENGNWENSEFRFTDEPRLQTVEMITYNGIPIKTRVYYVDDLDNKISMLREYINMLRLLELRIFRAVKDAEKKQQKQIDSVIGSF